MARWAILAIGVSVALSGCGGDDGPSAPSPPANPYTIRISPAGIVTPQEIVVPPGTRVLFVNEHTRRHDMTSDPHPDHGDCPAINSVGLLNPGQSKETGNLVAVNSCGYHDHEDFQNANLQGRIVIR